MDRQKIFDAINTSIETHAPQLAPDVRIAIATDSALKIEGVTVSTSDADAAAAQRFNRVAVERNRRNNR